MASLQPRTQSASGREGAERMDRSNQLSVVIDQSAAGVSVAVDPGSGGVRAERSGSSEMPESRSDFVSQTAGGELVMPQDCPELEGGAGIRGGGVKAVEGYRSPSPGGTRESRRADERSWGHGRGLGEADGGLVREVRIPESGCGFVLHGVVGEILTTVHCPGFARLRKGFTRGNCRWRKSAAADPVRGANESGFFHLFRVEDFLTTIFQGCRCAPRPGYSNCIPPGCTAGQAGKGKRDLARNPGITGVESKSGFESGT